MENTKGSTWKKNSLDLVSQYSKFFKKIDTFSGICPSCNSDKFTMVEFIYNTPYGDILVINGYCEKCGYKFFDIFNLKSHEPIELILKVNDDEDLRSLIIRSKTAKIMIPELNIEIHPGPASLPYITTVDGILYRVLDVLSLFSKEEAKHVEEALNEAINGKKSFTLIISDPYGNSAIIPFRKRKLTIKRD